MFPVLSLSTVTLVEPKTLRFVGLCFKIWSVRQCEKIADDDDKADSSPLSNSSLEEEEQGFYHHGIRMRKPAAARYCIAFLSVSRIGVAAFSSTFPHSCHLNMPPSTTRRRSPRLHSSESTLTIARTAATSVRSTTSRKRKQNTISKSSKVNKSVTSLSAKVPESSACSVDETPLLDLGTLVEGVVVKRPSSKIKSPYVADCRLVNAEPDAPMALAHAPALDVGGLCAPNCTVLMKERPPGGKTSHSIELVLAAGPNGDDKDKVLVGAHPQLGEKLAEEVLRRGLLRDELGFDAATKTLRSSPKKKRKSDIDDDHNNEKLAPGIYLKKQVTYGDSRVDFELTKMEQDESSSSKALLEVKNIVCSDYFSAHAPEKMNDNHCVIISPEEVEARYQRNAIFPWGRLGQEFEGKKVVSTRAIKHMRNLADTGKKNSNIQPIIMFVVNRSDCKRVRACHEQCPVFAEELTKAKKNGVKIVAFRVKWSKDGKAFFDGVVPVDA